MRLATKISSRTKTIALTGALLAGTALVTASFMGLASAAEPYVGYHVAKVITLPGKNPRWDHVSFDAANRNVLIGRRDQGVWVYNVDSGKISQVEKTGGTNGAAVAPELGLGMSDNGGADSVTVFDLKTLAVKNVIKLMSDTDGVGWEPVTKTAYTNNGENGSITLFDPATGKIGETIALNNTKQPEFFGADGKGRVFVNLRDQNKIAVVDFKSKKLATTWPVDCVQPTGLVYEDKSDRLFVSCRGNKPVLAVVDPNSGKTVTTIPIGKNTDAVLWDPTQKMVMSPNGADGTLSVIKQDNPDTYHLVETVSTRINARTGTVDPKTGTVYLVAPESTYPAAAEGAKAPPPKYISDTFSIIEIQRGQLD
ncbi:MAG TPA: hypothetical protein VKW08_00155 [Xanthobacteraceae bacterium]|nr:hypothetical protein [Xanthobacteraceae bacterium]